MLWLAVHFPDFGLEVASRGASRATGNTDGTAWSHGSPSSLPQVLIHDQQVIHCNSAAAACGIHPGNSLATAQSLAPETLEYFHWNGQHEQERLRFIAEVLYRFSADISPDVPDAIVLEAGRSLELFGDLNRLGASISAACEALGHVPRLRSAATPLAALALARADTDTLPDVALRDLACGLQPYRNGTGQPGHMKRADSQLPNKLVERLSNVGITRLGQVLGLPRAELAHRFGQPFANYLDRLCGHVPDPRATLTPPERFDSSLHLLEPIRDKASLEIPMQHLLAELGQWLIARQLGAEAVVWSFSAHASTSRACMPVRFARAQQQPEAFAGISRLKLVETPLPEEVLSVGLKARRLRPWMAHNHDLFPEALLPDTAPETAPETQTGRNGALDGEPDSRACIELLDRLGARLGESACMRLEARDCHVPEEAWQPLSATTRPARTPPPIQPGQRPLWLFTPPRPIDVDELVLLDGPERIQGQWWSHPLCRDYYVARHQNGARCWAFVDQSRQWYLHGYFA